MRPLRKMILKQLSATALYSTVLLVYPHSRPLWLLESFLLTTLIIAFLTLLYWIGEGLIRLYFFIKRRLLKRVGLKLPRTIEAVDRMSGEEFEHFTAYLLRRVGYQRVRCSRLQGDQGIDVFAYKGLQKWGFQCKCWSSNIGNRAVQEAYAGLGFYGLQRGVVLTNRYFTASAKALAKELNIELWDRDELIKLMKKGA